MSTRTRLVAGALLWVSACGSSGGDLSEPEPTPETAPESAEAPATPGIELSGLDGFWTTAQADELLERSQVFDVPYRPDPLRDGEVAAVSKLLLVGELMQELFERSRHPQALEMRLHLEAFEPVGAEQTAQLDSLRRLYSLFAGPIAYTLDAQRVPFAPVEIGYEPGRNVYPPGTDRETLEAYIEAHPEQRRSLTAVRTVVRQRDLAALERDRVVMDLHPWLGALHPELEERLAGEPDDDAFYAAPYALAYADTMLSASTLLASAATDVRSEDQDLADYLEQRARDLLSNDYEAGDAAWVSGRFQRLNAQVGAYETYDDHLLGQKAFFSTSILIRNPDASHELEAAVARLPEFEAALPGGPFGRVRAEIPIGIYDVVADFGQARGANTASILPNEAHITRKYGRTILIRRSMLENPVLLASAQRRFRAVVAEQHAADLGPRGNFDRTVWHEVGHYLGPKTTTTGEVVTEALGAWHNHIEEMKADLVSLWLMPRLVALGVIDEPRRRAAYAAGILRVLVAHEPPRENPYRTMQVMQQNWYLQHGVLRYEGGRLHIDYDAYPAAVELMLTAVLEIQRAGDPARAEAFIDRWAVWDPAIQGAIGQATDGVSPRFWIPRYEALRGE